MQKIIEVDKGDFRAFVYAGDCTERATPLIKTLPNSPISASDYVSTWAPPSDILLLLSAWYIANALPLAFLDVGSNIGTDAIRVAKLSALIGDEFPIVAFEPGVNSELLPYTLKLNGLHDRISFEPMCVADNERPMILYGEIGNSVNNRVVSHGGEDNSFCKLVDSTTLAAYLSRYEYRGRDPIIKIDTQGAEWLIWRGMKPLLAERRIAMVMEFTPWALRQFGGAAELLLEMLEHFHVFDLGFNRDRFISVSQENVHETVARIGERPTWADLLCLSRRLPCVGNLIMTAHPPN